MTDFTAMDNAAAYDRLQAVLFSKLNLLLVFSLQC